MTTREQIMRILLSLLADGMPAGTLVARNADIPLDVQHEGYVVIRDAVPTVEDSTLGDDKLFFMRMDVPIEIYAGGATEADRSALLDDLCYAAKNVIRGASALGEIVQYVEITTSEIETISIEGAATRHAAQITAAIEYDSISSIG